MIEIQCPNCERTLKVPDKYVGTEGACNYCGGRVQVQVKSQPPAAAAAAAAAAAVAAPIPAEGAGLLQAQLAEARAEIPRLSETADAGRLARENAETERDAALARVAEFEALVAQAQEREHALTPRADIEKARADLAESRQFAEWLGRELEAQREKTQLANTRLSEVRRKLAAVVDDLAETSDEDSAEVKSPPPEESARMDFTPADAAAILVGAGSTSKKARWAWLIGLAAGLLAIAAGFGVWTLAR